MLAACPMKRELRLMQVIIDRVEKSGDLIGRDKILSLHNSMYASLPDPSSSCEGAGPPDYSIIRTHSNKCMSCYPH